LHWRLVTSFSRLSKKNFLHQAPGCGCTRDGCCAGPGTYAIHGGGRRMVSSPM
jgi:hypothetical protein